jgi:hypothetical protein
MCERPSGNLVGGQLPGLDPAADGTTKLQTNPDGSPLFSFGSDDSGSPGDVAVAFSCDRGGVAWPNVVGLYSPVLRLEGSIDLGQIDHQEHSSVTGMIYRNGALHLSWVTNGPDGPAACLPVHKSGDFTVGSAGTVTASNVVVDGTDPPC